MHLETNMHAHNMCWHTKSEHLNRTPYDIMQCMSGVSCTFQVPSLQTMMIMPCHAIGMTIFSWCINVKYAISHWHVVAMSTLTMPPPRATSLELLSWRPRRCLRRGPLHANVIPRGLPLNSILHAMFLRGCMHALFLLVPAACHVFLRYPTGACAYPMKPPRGLTLAGGVDFMPASGP